MTEPDGGDGRVVEVDRTGLQSDAPPVGPVRTCIGCRGRDSRSALLRIVVVTDDRGRATVQPDPRRALPGRGAWLHPDIACLDLAVRRRAFSRAFRRAVEGADALRTWVGAGRSDQQK
ncbi:MAG TPA: YlxR family protein [Candidatus Janibacter merdipullorum]|nr:YlxR family protein [Candidatus Janibacter merdipullorum]